MASCLTVNGKTIGRKHSGGRRANDSRDPPARDASAAEGGIAILYGNLAPDGAVIKQTAASPELLTHRGRALVFENRDEMQAQIDSDDLPVDRDHRAGDAQLRPERRAGNAGVGADSHAHASC